MVVKLQHVRDSPPHHLPVCGTQDLALFLNTSILNGQSPSFFSIYETTKMITIDKYTAKNKRTRL
jgi:hypothetical protein